MEQEQYAVAVRGGANESLALQRVSEGLFKSGLFPNAKNPYGAFAITQYGAELGIGPMMSLKNINIISGQLAANGQLMLSLAMSKGVTFQVLSETTDEVSIKFMRGGQQYISKFTMKDAELAGLKGKDNWRKYPSDMLYWRCVAKGLRRIAPDAVMGLYTPDEISSGEYVDVSEATVPAPEPTKTSDKVTKAITWIEDNGLTKAEAEEMMGEEITETNLAKLKKVYKAWRDKASQEIVEPEGAQEATAPIEVACPNRNGDDVTVEYCNSKCESRQGCPAH